MLVNVINTNCYKNERNFAGTCAFSLVIMSDISMIWNVDHFLEIFAANK